MEAMTAEQAAEWGKTLSFEKVWAALVRTDEQITRMSKEVAELSISGQRTDEQIARMSKEVAELSISGRRTDEQIAKTSKEVAALSKNIGGVSRSLGRWTEEMVAARLWEKFDAFEYEFTKGSRNVKFRDGRQIIAEAD
ncbi:MAG: hypothetical protein LBG05_05880, partial [Treponema sp.]|nr:hypothetical protein [Treponema sp.]